VRNHPWVSEDDSASWHTDCVSFYQWPTVQDTGAPKTKDKPCSLMCPVYSTDTLEHLSRKEPVHNYILLSNFSWCKGDHTPRNPCVGSKVFYYRASPLTVVVSSVGVSVLPLTNMVKVKGPNM